MPAVAVTIITLNEASNIESALASVAWADEIVVVDSGSSDGTADLARRFTSKVLVHEWPGFAAQKNWASDRASSDWILSIDADERVTPELAEEIRGVLAQEPRERAFMLPRASFYLGRWIRCTDWYPDYQVRLYDRRSARWAGGRVHEGVRADGRVGRLRRELLHYPYRDISHHLRTIDRYTTLAAAQMREQGRSIGPAGLAGRTAAAFLRNYVARGGWRAGGVGFVVSALNSYYVFLKFAKLWEQEGGDDHRPD